jgi:hypothetical protein
MGLAERRATKQFLDNRYPAIQADIRAAAGFDVPIDIDWDSLAKEDYASSYEEFWPKVYFQPLIDALRSITRDDLGREALAAGLQRIVIRNASGYYAPSSAITFANKVLTIDHDSTSNVDDVKDRTDHMIRTLEKGL